MECLLLPPVRLSVSILKNGSNNVLINAHPNATILRVLQYICWYLKRNRNDYKQEYDMRRLALFYEDQELSLMDTLDQVRPLDKPGFLHLRLGTHNGNSIAEEPTEDFGRLNIQVQNNMLSFEKVHTVITKVNYDDKFMKLKKDMLNSVIDEELSQFDGYCKKARKHEEKDIVGFILKGKQEPVRLHDEEDIDYYDGLTIAELLELDLLPLEESYVSIMFQIKHKQYIPPNINTVNVQLISDASLYIDKVKVTESTTVIQLKDFISSVYMHSLKLHSDKIKLIYQGHLVQSIDSDTRTPLTVLQQCEPSSCGDIKLHVQISQVQEYEYSIQNYWEPLFADPVEMDLETRSDRDFESAEIQPIEFMTESGVILKRLGKLYEKCLLDDGQEIFVECSELDSVLASLHLGNEIFTLNKHDYHTSSKYVALSPFMVKRLEQKFGQVILQHDIKESHAVNNRFLPQRFQLPDRDRLFRYGTLFMRTMVIIGMNSIIPILFVIEFGSFLPLRYTILVCILLLGRALWQSDDLWDLYTPYFGTVIAPLGEHTFNKVRDYINRHLLSNEFYNNKGLTWTMRDILQRAGTFDTQEDRGQKFSLDHAFATLFAEVNDFEELRIKLQFTSDDMHELLFYICHDIEQSNNVEFRLPQYTKFFLRLRYLLYVIRTKYISAGLLENVVPNPRQDNLVMAIVKNIILLVLLLIPPVREMTHAILEERKSHIVRPEHEEPAALTPTGSSNTMATGIELHPSVTDGADVGAEEVSVHSAEL